MRQHTLTYPSTLESANQVLDDLQRLLCGEALEDDFLWKITLCVSEVFTNAVVHGNRQDPTKKVLFELQLSDSEIIADITDEGPGGSRQIDLRQPSKAEDEGGRGIDLINHFAAAVSYTDLAEGGMRVSMKFLTQKSNVES